MMLTIHEISSRQNAQFKQLREVVTDARARRSLQRAWVEGARLSQAAAKQTVERQGRFELVISEGVSLTSVTDALGIPDQQLQAMVGQVIQLSRALFEEISQVETSIGWGLVISTASATVTKGDIVILDRIQDPGNLGAIFRTAAAAGITQVWCLQGSTDPWSPKALRAGMGAHFALSIRDQLSESTLLTELASLGVSCFATANYPQAEALYAPGLPLEQPCAWIFGQEGDGVSETLMAQSVLVRIPQSSEVESLNVSHAAAVCLFEMQRRRHYAGQ